MQVDKALVAVSTLGLALALTACSNGGGGGSSGTATFSKSYGGNNGDEATCAIPTSNGGSYLEEALEIVRRNERELYWRAVVLGNTGAAKLALEDYAGSEELLLEAHAICADMPALSQLLAGVEATLVRLYQAWGKPGDAALYR